MKNYFDQFDKPQAISPQESGNYFDQFDAQEEPSDVSVFNPTGYKPAPMRITEIDASELDNLDATPEAIPTPPGVLDRFNISMKERGAHLADIVNATRNNQQTVPEGVVQGVMGQVGAAGDVVGAGVGALAKGVYNVMPTSVQQKIDSGIQSAGKVVAPVAQAYTQNLEAYNAANPRAGRNLEAARELVNVLPFGSAGVRKVAGEGLNAATQAVKNVVKAPFEQKAFFPSAQQMKTYTSTLFEDATAKGALIDTKILNNISNKINESMPGRTSLDPSPSVFAGMKNKVDSLIKDGKPITLDEFEEMDKSLTGLITEQYKTKGATAEATKLMELQTEIRDMIYNPESGMVLGGREGLDSYKNAVKEWSLAKRKEDIENILQRAAFTDNPATSIRRQFATLYMDKKRTRGYDKKQLAFIKEAAESSKFADFLRTTAGSRLIGGVIGGIAGGASTGGIGAIPGAIGGAMTGSVARNAATSLKKKSARKLEKSIAKQSSSQNIPKEYFKLAPKEAKEAIRKFMEQGEVPPADTRKAVKNTRQVSAPYMIAPYIFNQKEAAK